MNIIKVMETLNEYRHILDLKTKQVFLESFKAAIKKIDKNKFSFIGIVGSINEEKSLSINCLLYSLLSILIPRSQTK